MDSRVRTSAEQFHTLLEYMESHGDLSRPVAGAQGRLRSDQLWTELCNILNSVDGGVNRTKEKWKKVWADWKSKTKKKALIIRNYARGTGGGPAIEQTLSAMDERILAIMGPLAVDGNSVQEFGFNISQSLDRQEYSDIVVETPPIHPLVLASSSTQEQPIDAPSPPAAPATPATLGPPAATPAPAAPSAPTTPVRRRRRPGRGAAASPLSRRRAAFMSPSSLQSAASPGRLGPRGRIRRAPTPYERAASEFAAVELRRLELEETRIRLQNEHDMRALEVEHERTQVFRALVTVAQDWLDYFRSRDNTEPLNSG